MSEHVHNVHMFIMCKNYVQLDTIVCTDFAHLLIGTRMEITLLWLMIKMVCYELMQISREYNVLAILHIDSFGENLHKNYPVIYSASSLEGPLFISRVREALDQNSNSNQLL